ncbi:MAG: shikimate kinase [Gemmatimonadota bacterium]
MKKSHPSFDARGRSRDWRRVVLLGFMASGKTEVARALAQRLGWKHVDLDLEIERATGATVAEIFDRDGESAFRSLEAEHTPRALAAERTVLSPGGGWITNPGLFDALPPDTLTVWLKVSPAVVLNRLDRSEGGSVRPLLTEGDPESRVTELLASREALYARATVCIDTDHRSVAEIVTEVEEIIRAGRPAPLENET